MPPLISERYLQDDQLKAIGCMEVETAFLDHWIDLVIRRICGFDNAMFEAFIQETMPISGKLRVLRDIVFAKCKEQNKRAKFESWYSKLTTQITKRNTVVHGKWTAGITLADLLPDTRKSDAVVTKKRNAARMVKATEIAAIATAISELAMDMLEMLLFDELPLVPLL